MSIQVDPHRVYLLAEAAELLRLNAKTVREACIKGELPGRKCFGRWHVSGQALLTFFAEPSGPRKSGRSKSPKPKQDS